MSTENPNLTPCPACGREISKAAAACPQCGHPMQHAPESRHAPPEVTPTVVVHDSGSNTISAIASFLIPGLGQLAQGRLIAGFIMFIGAALLWLVMLGWIIHIAAALDAASFKRAASVR